MAFRPDFVVYAPDRSPTLAVEVKASKNISDAWAEEFVRDVLSHSSLPASTPFVLASPSTLYFWSAPGTRSSPPQKFSTSKVLGSYLGRLSVQGASERALEDAVKSWLSSVIYHTGAEIVDPDSMMKSTGLVERLKGGVLERQRR